MAIVDSKPNVSPSENVSRTSSKVPFSAHLAGTYRFGEYQPHYVIEAVPGDRISLRSEHDIRTYSLGAPLMNNVSIKKDYFQVPMESILPLNWEKIYTNPVIGDDVDASDVNCILDMSKFNFTVLRNRIIEITSGTFESYRKDTTILQIMVMLERFFSTGSLFSALGSHIGSNILFEIDGDVYTMDAAIDLLCHELFSGEFTAAKMQFVNGHWVPEYQYKVGPAIDLQNNVVCTYRQFLENVRDDAFTWIYGSTYTRRLCIFDDIKIKPRTNALMDSRLNMSRILAYQLCCSHFYSNDKIDYVYSAELFRQNVFSCINQAINLDQQHEVFSWNGLDLRYDYLSGYYMNKMLEMSMFGSITISDLSYSYCLEFWRLLLGFNRSLRFVDYFTGSKSQPLAVGDVNADVNQGHVNAVDITRSIQRQRFLNFVNRTGRKFGEYVSKLSGTHVDHDWHDPLYLAHTADTIFNQETENTGAAQLTQPNSITTVMRSNAGKFAFEVSIDRPSIIIGITYFDIPRYYSNNIERQWFHVDRFDMFNPFMQYLGDQVVYGLEIDASNPQPNFGYALRHMEYKTRVNTAFGGFCNNVLPGYQFIADDARIYIAENGLTIGPEYIRSRPSELDRFYVSLTGYSLGTYFHFIIDNNNVCEPIRPMAYAPTIL